MEKEIRLSYNEYKDTLGQLEKIRTDFNELENNGVSLRVYFTRKKYSERGFFDNHITTDSKYSFIKKDEAIEKIKAQIEEITKELFECQNSNSELNDKIQSQQYLLNSIYDLFKDIYEFEKFIKMNKLQKIFYILFKTK